MKIKQFVTALLLGCFVGGAVAAPLELADGPLYLGVSVEPNVLLMLDNSGSMKIGMYQPQGKINKNYNASGSYYGMFDEKLNYRYNPGVPVNDAYYSIPIDTSKTGAFYPADCKVQDDVAKNAPFDADCWDGKYLNWLTTRRIDATRVALVGGKVESRQAFNYGTIGGVSYKYKVVGQNEFRDSIMLSLLKDSNKYSPIPNDSFVSIDAPAHINGGYQQALYDPYAKIKVGVAGVRSDVGLQKQIRNASGTVIGETYTVTTRVNNNWTAVDLTQAYTNPIVVARPPSNADTAPGVVRIRNVKPTGFEVKFEEWDYLPLKKGFKVHAAETVSYMVVEAGVHTLPGGRRMVVGAVTTSAAITRANCNASNVNNFATVNFASNFTGGKPVVIASPNTANDSVPSTVRLSNITSNNFRVAQQREEKASDNTPAAETIGYIAVQPGTITVPGLLMEVGTFNNVNNAFKDVTFNTTPVSNMPIAFLANMSTLIGGDTANIRYRNLRSSTVQIKVHEEKSCDNEQSHSNEDVGYIAAWDTTGFNIALLKEEEPTGLLHNISEEVRLGVSFYRFPPNRTNNSGIYNAAVDGGTLEFMIPNNPFVRAPSLAGGGGYREQVGYIDTPVENVIDGIEHYPLIWGTTPLAENLWEAIQYFSQKDPTFTSTSEGVRLGFKLADDGSLADKKRDPYYYESEDATLWCAKSAVVLFTDGDPFKDNAASTLVPELKDFDNDGDKNDGKINGNDLDDVAYWGHCDRPKPINAPAGYDCIAAGHKRDLRSDLDGGPGDKGQNLTVHTVKFAGSKKSALLDSAAANAGGLSKVASDGAELEEALTDAFQAAAQDSSSASVALNSGSIGSNTAIYQSRFNSGDWSGELLRFGINIVGGAVSIKSNPEWDAADRMPSHADRNIVTMVAGTGDAVPFTLDDLPATMLTQLGATATEQEDMLNYLRGDQTNEAGNETGKKLFRTRTAGIRDDGASSATAPAPLGDLINSAPALLQPPLLRYPNYWGVNADENDEPYSVFKADNSTRDELLFVGGNDGMLHAFAADNGVEEFAYIPNAVFDRLPELASNAYTHQYYVDGSPRILDAFFDDEWHTVLTAGLNGGGQGVYALDVTSPDELDTPEGVADNVLWEFDDRDDADLGYTYSDTVTVRLNSGDWGVVFGNGYNNTVDNDGDGGSANDSTSGNAVLYIVDVEDGSIIKKFDTGVGSAEDPTKANRPNGLSTPTVVDVNRDSIIDYIYAGDLFGNLWKFDVADNSVSSWGFGYEDGSNPQPLYKACAVAPSTGAGCDAADAQPITTQPKVVRHPVRAGRLIYFGTGKYMERDDNRSTGQATQTFYAIWDKDAATGSLATFDRDELLEQELIDDVTVDGFEYRISTAKSIDWEKHNGWYLDLISADTTKNYGERQVSNAIIRGERVIFPTLIPSGKSCAYGGEGWLMELDLYSGSRLDESPFDTNNDNSFGDSDYIEISDGTTTKRVAASGVKSKIGIFSTPAIARNGSDVGGGGGTETKILSGSSGATQTILESAGAGADGRQSWRQLEF